MPDAVRGAMIYNPNADVFQACTAGAGWVALHGDTGFNPDPCSGSPAPGTTCTDGSVYAGTSPDGGGAMYTTPADAPGGAIYTWNDGSTNWVDTAMANCTSSGTETSCYTGEANTALLLGLNGLGRPSPYNAAEYCANLAPPDPAALGHNDWYLPAQDELTVLRENRDSIGGFSMSTDWHWSSSERSNSSAWGRDFSGSLGALGVNSKRVESYVRCVRKE